MVERFKELAKREIGETKLRSYEMNNYALRYMLYIGSFFFFGSLDIYLFTRVERQDLGDQFEWHVASGFDIQYLIKLAVEKNLNSIIEQYEENAERDIKNMRLDINELINDSLK
jgi:hypothetical protein